LPKTTAKSSSGESIKLNADKQILTYLSPTTKQKINQDYIFSKAKNATQGKLDMRLLFQTFAWSLDNALSPFLYDRQDRPTSAEEYVLESPKIHYACECIKSVKKYHEKRNQEVSGQIIYMNRGKEFFHFIKQYLEEEVGYKKAVSFTIEDKKYKIDEVEILDSSISTDKKENIKEAFLLGVCKVIIGTATIREGIDLQNKGTVIYNCYLEYNPTDIRQLEGRIHRQGNQYGYVRMAIPMVQDTMDTFIMQKLEEKTARINDIFYKGDRGNVLDVESLDPEEVKFALITDISKLAKMELDKVLAIARRKTDYIENNIQTVKGFKSDVNNYFDYKERLRNHIETWKKNISNYDYILVPYTDEQLSKFDKEKVKAIEKDFELLETINTFLSKSLYEDKELLEISRKVSVQKPYFDKYLIEYFKEYLSKVKKAERTILQPKGFTIDDDISIIIKEYEDELILAQKEYEYYKQEDYFNLIMKEIKEKKDKLNVVGLSAIERAKDFQKLNYLLDYKMTDVDISVCEIPEYKYPDEIVKKEISGIQKYKLKLLLLKSKSLNL